MDNKIQKNTSTTALIVVIAVVGVLITAAILFSTLHKNQTGVSVTPTSSLEDSKINVEVTSARALKANIELYYVIYGTYAPDIQTMISDPKVNTTGMLNQTIQPLTNLQYIVGSNKLSYSFYYTSVTGKVITTSGEADHTSN
jgi:hypothetical protein